MKSLTRSHLYPVGLLRIFLQTILSVGLLSSVSYAELTQEQAAQNKAIAKKLLSKAKPGQSEVNLGCIRLSIEQIKLLASDQKAGFVMEINEPPFFNRWPDGVVYYTFDPAGIEDGTIDALGRTAMGRKELVREAMDEWESAAQLTFIEIPFANPVAPNNNYIIIKDNANGNNSALGKNFFFSPQTLNMLSWDHPKTKGVIIHELGHALGMHHEQSRSDRDTYVEIRLENIEDEFEDQFNLAANSVNPGAYDFESIMHYGRNYFSVNGLDTIVMRPGFEQFQNVIGSRDGLSDLDRSGMAAIYGALSPTSAPAGTPPPGNYDNPIQFSLVINDAIDQGNTRYFYTLDGSNPTTSSSEYFKGDVIPINSNTTVKYFALQEQHSPSITVSIPYTFTNPTPMVATPVLSPPGGTYAPGTMFSVSTTTPSAQIYLSFGATIPTQSSLLYTAPFPLNSSTLIQAKAFKAGHTPSGVASANYEIQETQLQPPPSFYPNPAAQSYPGPLLVNISSNLLGVQIRYTLDGSEPNNTTSSVFDGQTPLVLNQTTTVKAKLFRDGYTPSNTATANYTVIPAADVPIINPNGGNFTGSVSVSLSLPPKSSKGTGLEDYIYYTTNGGEPNTNSTKYTVPFNLSVGNHTVKARTIFPGLPPSAIAQAQFTVFSNLPTLDPPKYTPVGRDHANSVQVTLQSFTEGAQIRYTVGDNVQPADPTAASTLYSGPFNLGLPTAGGDFWFLKAKAFMGAEESTIVGKTYSVFTPLGTINNPVFDPPGGENFDNPITVNMSATTVPPTAGIQIFRTTNGAEPIVPDPPTGGTNLTVNLSSDTDLKAIAYRAFFGESGSTTARYTFKCASPTIEIANPKQVDYFGAVTVVMSSTTTGGNTSIRYEMGGLEPTLSSTLYSDPIELGLGVHVIKAKTFRNNFADSDTRTASFIVSETPEAPIILLDPMSDTVDAFTDHTFIAEATGVPDPDYSWYFQSLSATQAVRLAGEIEPTLTIFNVLPANAGDYYMVASNSAGSATSTIATLTVNQVDTPTPSQTYTPSETPTGTLPTATPSNTTIDGGTATATSTPTPSITPTPTEIMAQKVIISASQDNTLIEDASGERSNATSPYFWAGLTGTNPGGGIRRGLAAFDIIGSVSAGATIQAVTLTCFLDRDDNPQDAQVSIHRVDSTWGEGTSVPDNPAGGGRGGPATEGDATWLHRFYDTVNWATAGGDFSETPSASTTVGAPGSAYNWGSTGQMVLDVQGWLDDPENNAGWLFMGDEETPGNSKRFAGKDHATEENRPALCVEFLPPAPPTPTPTATVEGATETATPTATPTGTIVDATATATSTPTLTATPQPTARHPEMDCNGNGVIDSGDLLCLLEDWMRPTAAK